MRIDADLRSREMDLDDLVKAKEMAVKQIKELKARYSKQQLAA